MTALYDLVLMLDPNVPDERHQQILAEVRSTLERDGTLVGAHDWGLRRMAYEIDHRPEAVYHLFQFEGERELLERLNHTLRITDGVLRFRLIRLKPGSPPPPTPRPERPRGEEAPPERPRRDRDRDRDRDEAPAPPREEAPAPPPEEAPTAAAAPAGADE